MKKFLHHLLFRRVTETTSNVIGFLHFSNCWTLLKLATFGSFGSMLVWCTIFTHKMAILGKVSMEMRPSAFAPFSQVIAIKQELG
jgi:hypothetical protein